MSTKQPETKNAPKAQPVHQPPAESTTHADLELILSNPQRLVRRLPVQRATRTLRREAVLALQRQYGNRYVRRLLAERGHKMPEGLEGEQELSRPDVRANKIPPEGLEEEELIQRPPRHNPAQDAGGPTLVMGPPGDVYEQEADRVSAQVTGNMAALESPAGEAGLRQVLGHIAPDEEVSRLLGPAGVQTMAIGHTRGKSGLLRVSRLSADGANGDMAVPSAVAGRILQSKGQGKAVPDVIRRTLEAQMGHDFSAVRVKNDVQAHELCRQLGARAFTHGRDIWLGRGESMADVQLMAHELTHVVQQGEALALSPQHIIERVDPKRETVKRLENFVWHKNSGSGVTHYRQRMLSFQREMSGGAVDALQTRLLGAPEPAGIHHQDGSRRLRRIWKGGGGSAPTQFPTITEAAADTNVSSARTADWTASLSDFAERFSWITWDSSTGRFNPSGRVTGTWQGVTPGAKPADSGTVYHSGEYHQHPTLPPAQQPNTHSFPVGPSAQDTSAANADDSPGIVRDFTTTARTAVTDYTYGPTRRSGTP